MVTPISIKDTTPETLVNLGPSKSMASKLLYYVLVRCDLYFNLEGVSIENSNLILITDVDCRRYI